MHRMLMTINNSCAFRIVFGSYASGIDPVVFAHVFRLIVRDPAISKLRIYRWGFEGETTLCIDGLNNKDGNRLFFLIKGLIPAESKRAWTKVIYGDNSFGTLWPK